MKKAIVVECVRYALLTARDMCASYDDAIRAMRDEPAHVAEELGCAIEDVITFCESEGRE